MLLAVVIAGLAAGAGFIFVMAVTADSIPSTVSSTGFIIAANGLDEVKTFLSRYPDAKVTVYFNPSCVTCRPPIVEYSHQEGTKYTDIRIVLDSTSGKAMSKQVRCVNLEDTFDSVEIHGTSMNREEITKLLEDPHCP